EVVPGPHEVSRPLLDVAVQRSQPAPQMLDPLGIAGGPLLDPVAERTAEPFQALGGEVDFLNFADQDTYAFVLSDAFLAAGAGPGAVTRAGEVAVDAVPFTVHAPAAVTTVGEAC